MGVPKFFRWISERYPCLSEVVKEYQIPEFDNLYLDMNGIIHVCSHPNDDDPHFRITEEKIFKDIFHYIEFLFHMIKPQKVFFMAVDGVAPRAKMNQQRGRRFRSAKEAELLEKKALERGEVLPSAARFDSNCITPGTSFMCRLHEQLKFFVSMKLSSDPSWRDCQIYLSGHETPGEGEHKIMDFIRHQRSQPDYDPNTRHCLYGLDADLIMLGLCSHEPRFSLLREEVKYGKNQNRPVVPEQTTFNLLHLSLMREYLDNEFSALKKTLPFEYDLEKIIDDWVLMGFLVGNDFIPNIPHLHITSDALPLLYKTYIDVMPAIGGYINESGYLNLKRFQQYMKKLAEFDYKTFSENRVDFKQIFGKGKKKSAHDNDSILDVLSSVNNVLPASEDASLIDFHQDINEEFYDDDSDDSDDLCHAEFQQHKRDYYMNKLDYANVTADVMKEQAYEYVRAIQWNLHYYYNGIASWSWYYPHHYSPYISDVKDFSEMEINFEMGTPFFPFEQLLAVLPAASKDLLPVPYQGLMCHEESPLKMYYPEDFKTDLNGKKQEWEAVVLIPFINEKLLLESMKALEHKLNPEEKQRNCHGPHLLYTYSPKSLGSYISPASNYFPNINVNHGRCKEVEMNFFRLPVEQIKKGLLDNCKLNVFFPGFPTLKHIKHKAVLKCEKVKVFQQPSRGQNMMLVIDSDESDKDISTLARKLLGKCVYVSWPHLAEARVIGVSDGKHQIVEYDNMETLTDDEKENFIQTEQETLTKSEQDIWMKQLHAVKTRYHGRFGIETGDIKVLIHATILTGIRYVCKSESQVIIEKQWSSYPGAYALQAVVQDITVHTMKYQRFNTLDDLYPAGTIVFLLSGNYYGEEAVVEPPDELRKGRIRVKLVKKLEPSIAHIPRMKFASSLRYMPGYVIAERLGISSHLLSCITGTVYIQTSHADALSPSKSNIGLNLKFNKKNEETPGYTKKRDDGTWLYSQNTLNVMNDYFKMFPELIDKLVDFIDEDVILVDSIFPGGDGRHYIHKVCSWIKTLPCSNLPRQKCGEELLDEVYVQEIEKEVQKSKNLDNNKAPCFLQVRYHVLYRPVHMQAPSIPDPAATYQLYDRIVNVREGWTVPLALRGTVIGIHHGEKLEDLTVDVVFDEEFSGGLALNCSPNKGYCMSVSSLMNLSHGKRMLSSSKKNAKQTTKSLKEEPSPNMASSRRRNESLPPRLQATRQHSNNQASRNSNNAPSTSRGGNINRFNHSPDSPFVPHNMLWGQDGSFTSTGDDQRSFVTPKLLPQNVQGYREAPGFFKKTENEIPSTSKAEGSEFLSMWEGLRQSQCLNSPSSEQHPHHREAAYGRQVSVDELFRNAKEIEDQTRHPQKRSDPPIKRNPEEELMQFVTMNMGGGIPVYRFNTVGPMQHIQAEVILPNGMKCRSFTAPTRALASENAAENALALLIANSRCRNGPQNIRSPVPHPFSAAAPEFRPAFSQVGMPSIFPGNLNVLRQPFPSSVNMIPSSYIEYNQQLYRQPQTNVVGAPFHNRSSSSQQSNRSQEVPVANASSRRQESKMDVTQFVPHQVAQKARKGKLAPKKAESVAVESVTTELEKLSITKEGQTETKSLEQCTASALPMPLGQTPKAKMSAPVEGVVPVAIPSKQKKNAGSSAKASSPVEEEVDEAEMPPRRKRKSRLAVKFK